MKKKAEVLFYYNSTEKIAIFFFYCIICGFSFQCIFLYFVINIDCLKF